MAINAFANGEPEMKVKDATEIMEGVIQRIKENIPDVSPKEFRTTIRSHAIHNHPNILCAMYIFVADIG